MPRKIVSAVIGFTYGLTLAAHVVHAADKPVTPLTGDQHRTYVFALTGDTMPYRLVVPPGYDGSKAYPLVVVLHGGGADHNRPVDNTGLVEMAAQRGYIVLSPLGYNRYGGFGNIYPVVVTPKSAAVGVNYGALAKAEGPGKAAPPAPSGPSATPPPPPPPPAAADDYFEQPAAELTDAHIAVLSEAETLAVIAEVEQEYRIDRNRVYLMGNSAGGVGTLFLAAKYPQMWAAISPQAGPIAAWSYPYWRLRDAHVPALFVQGDMDGTSNAKWSRTLAEQARADGADATFLLVAGGTHGGAWVQALPQIFDFFDAHVKAANMDVAAAH
jgi:poly(3-hydroxybutyrate) depolymerase